MLHVARDRPRSTSAASRARCGSCARRRRARCCSASLDAARRQLAVHGEALLHETLAAARRRVRGKLDAVPGAARDRRRARRPAGRRRLGPAADRARRARRPAAPATRSPRRCATAYDVQPELATHATRRARARDRPSRAATSSASAGDVDETVKRLDRAPGERARSSARPGALENEVVVSAARRVPRRGGGRRGRRRGRPRLVRVDRRLPAGHPGAAAGRADHRRARRLPARARSPPARACTGPATRRSARSTCCAETGLDGSAPVHGARSLVRVTIADELVARALAEDVGPGDVTAEATVAPAPAASRRSSRRRPASSPASTSPRRVFRAGPRGARRAARARRANGARAGAGAGVDGAARALLAAERTALNFLGRLSGVATLTARVVRAVEGGGRCQDPRHAQDDAGPAGAGEGGRARRRRHQPPRRAVRRDPHQGEPHRRRRRGGEAVRRARAAPPELPLEVEVPRRRPRSTRRWRRARRASCSTT